MTAKGLRIVYVIDEMEAITAGGTERQILDMLKLLHESGADVRLAMLRGTAWLKQEDFPFPIRRFDVTRILSPRGLAELRRVFAWIRSQRCDALQSFFIEANIFGPILGFVARVPVRIGSRRNLNHALTRRLRWAQSLSNLFATGLMANCEAVRHAVERTERFAAGKIQVIPNILDVDGFRPDPAGRSAQRRSLGIGDGEIVVGNTSTLRHPKGVDDFLRAAALAHRQDPRLRFLLVGDGPLRGELEGLVASLGITQRVIFAGAQTTLAPWLRAMDFAALTSHAEGLSNSILEYLAAGLPCVVTDVGGNREAVGDCGRVVPTDPVKIAEQIVELASKPEERQHLSRCALQRAQLYSREAAKARLTTYYHDLVHAQTHRQV